MNCYNAIYFDPEVRYARIISHSIPTTKFILHIIPLLGDERANTPTPLCSLWVFFFLQTASRVYSNFKAWMTCRREAFACVHAMMNSFHAGLVMSLLLKESVSLCTMYSGNLELSLKEGRRRRAHMHARVTSTKRTREDDKLRQVCLVILLKKASRFCINMKKRIYMTQNACKREARLWHTVRFFLHTKRHFHARKWKIKEPLSRQMNILIKSAGCHSP